MHFCPTASNYHKWSTEYIPGISDQQLLVLYVAANYKLRRNRMGWCAGPGYQGPDNYVPDRTHQFVIKSLLKRGLLEGNSCGERAGLRELVSSINTKRLLLWISAKGRTLLGKIAIETGFVFDEGQLPVDRTRSEGGNRTALILEIVTVNRSQLPRMTVQLACLRTR